MSEQDDKVFMQHFGLILVGLAVFTLVLIVLAIRMHDQLVGSENPAREVAKVERIAPVFDVYTGDAERVAALAEAADEAAAETLADAAEPAGASAAAESAAETAAESAPAETASGAGEADPVAAADGIDGEAIYTSACQACHMSGAAGAPQLVAEQWEGRLDKGLDTLVDHAINGFGAMPAKGGRVDLSDAEVRASVEYMVGQVED